MSKQMSVVRIYISESDSGRKGNLMKKIMGILHDEHRVRGVTVFRGVTGFGSKGLVHAADLLRLDPHLPEVIEFFDDTATVEAAIEALAGLVPEGHIISWQVEDDRDHQQIDPEQRN